VQRTACRRPPDVQQPPSHLDPRDAPPSALFLALADSGVQTKGDTAATYHIPQPAVWSPISLPTRAETISVWGEGVFCVGCRTRPAPTGHTSPGPQQVGDGRRIRSWPTKSAIVARRMSGLRPGGPRDPGRGRAQRRPRRGVLAAARQRRHIGLPMAAVAVGGDGPSALLRVGKGQGVGRTPPPGPRPGPHQRAFTLLHGQRCQFVLSGGFLGVELMVGPYVAFGQQVGDTGGSETVVFADDDLEGGEVVGKDLAAPAARGATPGRGRPRRRSCPGRSRPERLLR
jgi:hypothetical protein